MYEARECSIVKGLCKGISSPSVKCMDPTSTNLQVGSRKSNPCALGEPADLLAGAPCLGSEEAMKDSGFTFRFCKNNGESCGTLET